MQLVRGAVSLVFGRKPYKTESENIMFCNHCKVTLYN